MAANTTVITTYLNLTFAGWCHARVSVGFDECLDAPHTSAQFQQLVQDAYLGWMEPIQRTVDLSRSFENLSGTCLKFITCRSGFLFSPVIGHRQQMNLADSWVKKILELRWQNFKFYGGIFNFPLKLNKNCRIFPFRFKICSSLKKFWV